MNTPQIRVEIKRIEDLKEEVRKANGLPDAGVVIRTVTKSSPKIEHYEVISESFIDRIQKKVSALNPEIVKAFREEF